jgi:glucose/arabinose dehydrogenase
MARKILFAALGLAAASVIALAVAAGRAPRSTASARAPDRDVREFQTEDYAIRVETVVGGLEHPWSLAFLPGGDMLVTERAGRLRRIHNGVLQPASIAGAPLVHSNSQEGLLDIALHPQFAQNHLVYLTYSKGGGPHGQTTVALARGWLGGDALMGTKDIFVSNTWSAMEGNMGSRLAFLSDGTLLMSTGERHERKPSQDRTSDGGKILHLRDDGSMPEMYSMGHRNPQGLVVHPSTGVIFEDEH